MSINQSTKLFNFHDEDCDACEYEASKGRSWLDISESSLSLLFIVASFLFLIIYRPTSEEIKLYGNIIIRFADNYWGKTLIATLCYIAIRNIDLSPIAITHTCIGRASNNMLYSGASMTDSATQYYYVKQNNEKL